MGESIRKVLDINPKPVNEQLKKLRKFFPNSKFEDLEDESVKGFVIPDWNAIACNYQKALEKVFLKMDELKGIDFVSCHEWKKGIETLRQTDATKSAFEIILAEQEHGNFIVVPVDFGKDNLGKTISEVLAGVEGKNFGLSAFHLSIIILTHFDRLVGGGDLWINCPGDEVLNEKNEFGNAPFISVQAKKIWFCSHGKTCKVERFISAKTKLVA